MRWAIGFALAVPVALAAGFLIVRFGGNEDLARNCVRGLRYVIAAELVLLVVLSVIGFGYEHRARRHEAALFHPPGRLVDIGGYRLHLDCTGSGGPTVVLEHGHRATYLDWFRVQPQVATFTRVCSYDRAGYGWSDRSPKNRVPSVMAEELHALLNAADEKPPYVLVAHSYGALNAVMFADKFPDEIAGVILVDGSTAESLLRASWHTRLWLRMMHFTMPFGLPRWREWCRGGPEEISDLKQALTCRSQFLETILEEDAAFPEAANQVRTITSLGIIPLVVIARDTTGPRNRTGEAKHGGQQRGLAKLSTNSSFVVAEGSGHDVPLARPDVIVEAVKSLLRPQAPADSRGTP